MTLDEAIARCEKIVKEAKKSYEVPVADGIMAEVGMELTKKGIEEYQQYTKWLKELAERREQPEIVHCGDCKHYKIDHPRANGYHCCYRCHNIFPMREDDFCSRAEKRYVENG